MRLPGKLADLLERRAATWAWLWALATLWVTLMPASEVPKLSWAATIHLDKIVHAVLFGVQGLLLALALSLRQGRMGPRGALWAAWGGAVLLGAAVEVLQEWMQLGRHGDVVDLLADAAGAAAGIFLLHRHRARHRA